MDYWVTLSRESSRQGKEELECRFRTLGGLTYDQFCWLDEDGFDFYIESQDFKKVTELVCNLPTADVFALEYGDDLCFSLICFLHYMAKMYPNLLKCVGEGVTVTMVDPFTITKQLLYFEVDVLEEAYSRFNCEKYMVRG